MHNQVTLQAQITVTTMHTPHQALRSLPSSAKPYRTLEVSRLCSRALNCFLLVHSLFVSQPPALHAGPDKTV